MNCPLDYRTARKASKHTVLQGVPILLLPFEVSQSYSDRHGNKLRFGRLLTKAVKLIPLKRSKLPGRTEPMRNGQPPSSIVYLAPAEL